MWQGRTRDIERPPIAAINSHAAELRAAGRDLIDLGQAILGLPPPAGAMAQVRAYLDRGGPQGYSPDPGLPEVLEAVAGFLAEEKGITDATADRIILTCGANQAYVNALLACTVPGDEVIHFAPYYFDHDFAIKLAACTPVAVPLARRERRFELDFDALAAALTPRTRCLTLVSPSNPSGMVLPRADVERLCRLCAERDLWLISDETYDLLTFPPAQHVAPAALRIAPRTITLGSFSKIFGLAAWRIGYLLGPADFVAEAIKVQDALVVCAPVPSQLALLGALPEARAYCDHAILELQRRRDLLLEALTTTPLLEPTLPDGATFILARITTDEPDVALAHRLLDEAGLITVPGSAFGPTGRGFLRLSYGNQPVNELKRLKGSGLPT